jgi:hypothetical protein
MIALKKKKTGTKCGNHCTISLIAYTTKIVAHILKGLKGKSRMHLEKISLDLEEEKELGMPRIISK